MPNYSETFFCLTIGLQKKLALSSIENKNAFDWFLSFSEIFIYSFVATALYGLAQALAAGAWSATGYINNFLSGFFNQKKYIPRAHGDILQQELINANEIIEKNKYWTLGKIENLISSEENLNIKNIKLEKDLEEYIKKYRNEANENKNNKDANKELLKNNDHLIKSSTFKNGFISFLTGEIQDSPYTEMIKSTIENGELNEIPIQISFDLDPKTTYFDLGIACAYACKNLNAHINFYTHKENPELIATLIFLER